jgi:SnoaL-like domain
MKIRVLWTFVIALACLVIAMYVREQIKKSKADAAQNHEIQRLMDAHQIQQLMSRYEYLHTAGMNQESADLFATKTPGVKVEIAHLGIYDGSEGIYRFFVGAGGYHGKQTGILILHALTTPVIEVAGDGKTAQGVWLSPGVESAPNAAEKGGIMSYWAWIKYGADFVKEDGQWKFWHFHVYRIFESPYNKSWSDPSTPADWKAQRAKMIQSMPAAVRPDRPNNYEWLYGPKETIENIPAPPQPYQTWDESRAYVK